MKCPECGSEVTDGEQFCGNCGAPVEPTEGGPADQDLGPVSDETVIAEAPVIPESPPEPEEPDFAPPPPPPPEPPAAEGGKQNKTTMIIAIVVAVIILLCCCCLAALGVLIMSEPGQDLLYELGLAMRPLLTLVV